MYQLLRSWRGSTRSTAGVRKAANGGTDSETMAANGFSVCAAFTQRGPAADATGPRCGV